MSHAERDREKQNVRYYPANTVLLMPQDTPVILPCPYQVMEPGQRDHKRKPRSEGGPWVNKD